MKAQVWIETVLYTLIGLALIALVLVFATPKITEYKERNIIEQSMASLQSLGDKIDEVSLSGPGTKLIISAFIIKKGKLIISPKNKTILMRLDKLTILYSENGTEISVGKLNITSLEDQKTNSILLKLTFSENISYENKDAEKEFPAAAIPYKFSIEKIWETGGSRLNIEEVS
jgi:type II secretory pathway pseudopilin PulG